MVPFPALQLPIVTLALVNALDPIEILVATGMEDGDGFDRIVVVGEAFARAAVRTVLEAGVIVVGGTVGVAIESVGGDVGGE